MSLTVQPINLGHYGTAWGSYQAACSVASGSLSISFAFDATVALQGRALAFLIYADLGAPDANQVHAMFSLAMSKVRG